MPAASIRYREGYKYQLAADYVCMIPIRPAAEVSNRYARLETSGKLVVREDYAWDGPSGPTIDTTNFMRASLVHDVLYQFMREGRLAAAVYREPADRVLQQMCIEDGMTRLRAWWVYQGVRFGGGPSADPRSDKPILVAP